MEKYQNREDAGRHLVDHLKDYANRQDVIVLALPRGGVPVAFEIAIRLNVPLDVFIVRKLGVPGHEELAMGAISEGGVTVFNHEIINQLNISESTQQQVISAESQELRRRETLYRGNRPFPPLENKTVILVDDGIATGATIRAAIKALRQFKPASLVVAVPVAEKEICNMMSKLVDQFICPLKPTYFYAVGAWYEFFDQTSDQEVHDLLAKANPA